MLFGPLLVWEWVRSARRRRHLLLRFLYAVGLLLLLCWSAVLHGDSHSLRRMSQVAESFFHTLMWVQLVVVLLLTPAYTAGAIAEEKARQTLAFLLTTDLRNREIILEKLAVRLAHLGLLLLTGLPVLSFTQFWGGVDPNLVLAGFAALGITLLSLGAVSILCSVYARKPWDALVLAYGVVAAYLGLSALGQELLPLPLARLALPFASRALTVGDLVAGFSAGDLFNALSQLSDAVALNRPLVDILPGLLLRYGLFHGLTAAACLTWAVLRLRPVALRQIFPPAQRVAGRRRLFQRPGVGDRPLLWKEIFVEGGFRFGWPGRLLLTGLVLASFVYAGLIMHGWFDDVFLWGLRPPSHSETVQLNEWVRLVGTGVACLLLLGVALRAANSISGERDRQTLESLLTTPLETKEILSAKWRGSLLSVRWGWLWLGSIWLVGVITGSLHPLAVPLLIGAWLVYADVAICIGLRFSLSSRTTLRAILGTVVTVVGIWVGHFVLLGMCCLPLLLAGLPAPLTLGLLAFDEDDISPRALGQGLLLLGITGVGLVCWKLVAWSLWVRLQTRFGQLFLRQPPRPPARVSPPRPPARPINAVLISEERPVDQPPAGSA